ncbi:sugar ABC transporter permease [soil metagenome]
MFQQARRRLILPFILPQLILYVVVMLIPLTLTVYYGFTNWQGHGNPRTWVGFQNFDVLLQDGNFHNAIENSFRLTAFGGFLLFVPALAIAWALQQPLRAKRMFSFLILAPVVIAASVAGLIWKWIYNPSQGLLNPVLENIGAERLAVPWLGSPRWALIAIIVASIWHGIGTWILLISAGMDRIPPDLPDAAKLDGASDWQVFRNITIPLLWEVLRILIVLWIIQALQAFTFIFVMTGPVAVGGPLGSTDVMVTYVYRVAFNDFKWAYGSAMATVMLVMIFVLSLLVNRVTVRETVEY